MAVSVTGVGPLAVPGTYRLRCDNPCGTLDNMTLFDPDGTPIERFTGVAVGVNVGRSSDRTLAIVCSGTQGDIPKIAEEWTIEITA